MPKTFRAPLLAAALLVSAASQPLLAAETTTVVPRHTMVPVILTKEIRVGGMGDSQQKKVEFEAAQDVIINGFAVVKKGDTVEGRCERGVTR